MQKILNNHASMPYLLVQRLLLKGKTNALILLAMLLNVSLVSTSQAAFFERNIIRVTASDVNSNGTFAVSRYGGFNASPSFNGRFLSTFYRDASTINALFINGEVSTLSNAGDDIQSVILLYRVFPTPAAGTTASDNTKGNFIPVILDVPTVDATNPLRTFWTNGGNGTANLIALTPGQGNYTVEVYFVGSYTNPITSTPLTQFLDTGNGNNYSANFSQIGLDTPVSTWNGNTSSDPSWFNDQNWTPAPPTKYTDVTVNSLSGNAPVINSSNGRVAETRNLTINNNNGTVGLDLAGSQLRVYGTFRNPTNGLSQTGDSEFVLAGGDQSFDGAEFKSITITGGGTKTLTNRMTVAQKLTLDSGVLITRTDNANVYSIDLSSEAMVVGERDYNGPGSSFSYITGVLRNVGQLVIPGTANNFGNLGVSLTNNGGSPSIVTATRYSRVYTGVGTSQSIRRGFTFSSTNLSASSFSLAFNYLNVDLNNINAQNLVLFRSANGRIPFQPLFKTTLNTTTKVLTLNNIAGPLSATFTLGDATNPLPVTVTSFKAVAQGNDAVLDWATAQEINNSGFEVQVSTDGATFSKVGFVAAASPNSSVARSYQYRDATTGKQGIRYYRLRQLDVDGTQSLFGPKPVAFGGATLATSAQGYPNPFTAEINLALQTVAAGPATITVFDGVGRQVRMLQPTLEAGASNVKLSDLQTLPHGMYVVQVRYNDGQMQRLKLTKN